MVKELDGSLAKVGRTLCGGNPSSIAKAVFAHDDIREQILLKVMDLINDECTAMCRRAVKPQPLFRRVLVDQFESLAWSNFIKELQCKCPTLLRLLKSLVSRNDHRNAHKHSDAHIPGICMATAVILKERNREMCGVQTFVSLVLFNSHVQKKVGIQ